MANIFQGIPDDIHQEIFTDLLNQETVRIERIVSLGHSSPVQGWYEQEEHEWVLVLKGRAIIAFDSGDEIALNEGDYLNIPAYQKHRVQWTDPDKVTLWLAIFYQSR